MKSLLVITMVLMASCASYVDGPTANKLYGHIHDRYETMPTAFTPAQLQEAKALKDALASAGEMIDPEPFLGPIEQVTLAHDVVVLASTASAEKKTVWLTTSEMLRDIFRAALER